MDVSRRKLLSCGLKSGLAVAASSIITPNAFATYQLTPYHAGPSLDKVDRSLSFFQTHTGEHEEATYYKGGDFSEDGLKKLNHILRDHRTGDVTAMDEELFNLLHDLKLAFNTDEPFHIISGYRSPKTNAMLSGKSKGVAKKSYHMRGMAIDIRIPGVKTADIRDYAKKMQRGGVGYYRSSDFVHVDTGRVRSW